VFLGVGESVDCLVLCDHTLFPWGLDVWMSRYGLGSKGIFLEKTLFYKLLHVVPEGPTVDGLMSLALVVEAVFLRPGERRIIMEWLIFDGVKDFVDH